MIIPLESVCHETFSPYIGKEFEVSAEGGPVSLVLVSVKLLGHKREDAIRDPFALAFSGEKGLRLPQATRRFRQETIGEIDMFLTQVADGAKGSEFEAIFT